MLQHRRKLKICLAVMGALILIQTPALFGSTYYVDNSYSTNGNGTAATEASYAGGPGAWNDIQNVTGLSPGDILEIREGTGAYRLTNPWAINWSGTAANPVIIQNYAGDDVVISGERDISGATWTHRGNGVYEATAGTTGTLQKFPFTAWYDRGAGEERLNLIQTNRNADSTLAAGYMRYTTSNHVVAHLSDGSSPANASYFRIPWYTPLLQYKIANTDYVTVRKNPSGGSFTVHRARDHITASTTASVGLVWDGLTLGWNMDRTINQTEGGLQPCNYKVLNCDISYAGQEGIRWSDDSGPNALIANNDIHHIQTSPEFELCGYNGLPGFSDMGTLIRICETYNGTIRGNILRDSGGGKMGEAVAIDSENGSINVLIEDNLIYNLNLGNSGSFCGQAFTFHGVDGHGPMSVDGTVVQNNRIYNVDAFVFFDYGNNSSLPAGDLMTIRNNTFVDASWRGVTHEDGYLRGNVRFVNNIFASIGTTPDYLFILDADAMGVEVPRYNVFYSPNDADGVLVNWKGSTYTAATISNWGTGNVSGNPHLDLTGNPPSLNITSTSSSAYNAASATYAPADDYEGDSRPQDGADDIGADEYVSDANVSTVTVTATDSTATEASQTTGTYRISRGSDTTGNLSVNYSMSGTATNGTDYSTLSGSGTISNGNTYVDVTLTPTDDGDAENTETAILTVTSGSGYNVGSPSSATVNITDDDSPAVTITASDASASEEGPDNGQFTVSRGSVTEGNLSVNYSIGGTATNSDDYDTLSGSVTISDGYSSTTVTLTPNDDASVEGQETVILTVTSGSGYSVGSPSQATVTIDDNDAVTVTISATDASADETGPDTGTFNVSRGASSSGNLTVNYSVGGTASASDYDETLSGSVQIDDGQTSVNITITPNDDASIENDETVILTVTSGAGYNVGSPSQATVTIADNDEATVTISATDPNAVEDDAGDTITFNVSRGAETGGDLAVNYTVSGTATNGTDYSTLDGDVVILNGNTSVDIVVNPTDETTMEADETIILTLAAGTGYSIGSPSSATGTINNDDVPTVTLSATDASASETGPDTGTIAVSRGSWSTGNLTVLYSVSGTAEAADYDETLSGSVVITNGNTSVDITITPNDDVTVENDETVTLTLTADSAYTVGSGPATVTISDNDTTAVTISATDATATEAGETSGTIQVSRGSDSIGDMTVNFTVGGTASSSDYEETLGTTVVIADGNTTEDITITAHDDSFDDDDETVILTLASGTGYSIGSPNSATVTITDDDEAGTGGWEQDSGPNGIVSMEAEHYDAIESGTSGDDWNVVTTPAGASDGNAMQALPDDGDTITSSIETAAPELQFEVNFVKTGQHYIWLLGNAQGSGGDDSAHFGFDGSYVATVGWNGAASWEWRRGTLGTIQNTGVQTVNVWMREDGIIIDKVVLTTNEAYTPTGTGPAESPHGTISTYTLTVNNGVGSGTYEADDVVDIYADTPAAGSQFDQWTGDTGYVANVNASDTTVTMPAANVTVTATYEYELTVTDGTGDGYYDPTTVVGISADAPGAWEVFDAWTGDTGYLDSTTDSDTNVTMPSAAVTVIATYANLYQLTVTSGTGDGNYVENAVVAVSADEPNAGWGFDNWTGDTAYLDYPNNADANVTMPNAAVTITASYSESDPNQAFQQIDDANGIVSMEAENYDDIESGTCGDDWNDVTSPAGYSGSGAMQALPDDGDQVMSSIEMEAAELKFEVDFVKTGTHYIWIRGHAQGSSGGDSCYGGWDGSQTTYHGWGGSNEWQWKKATLGNITTTGRHTVHVYEREDGLVVDKVVLTTNNSYTPSGTGPAESSRE